MFDGIRAFGPSISYTGGFRDNHDPGVRLEGDPYGISNLSNNGNWDFRAKIPVGKVFKNLFKEKKYSNEERDRMIERQRTKNQREGETTDDESSLSVLSGGTVRPGMSLNKEYKERSTTTKRVDPANMTPEDRKKLEDEQLFAQAEAQRERDLAAGRITEEETEQESGEGFKIPNPLTPLINILKNRRYQILYLRF